MARTDRPRVLQVIEAFGGGALEIVKTISEEIASDGDTVAIAYGVRPETPSDVRARVAERVELFPLPWTARTARAQLGAARALRRLVRAWRPDVVHLHSSFAGVIGALALPRGVPIVYTPHAYSFTASAHGRARRAAFRALEWLVARRATVVAAVSETEARLAREVVGARSVVCIRNGIPELDDRGPEQHREPPEQPSVIAMGRIVPQRRPEECAGILAGLNGGATVAWVGGGDPDSAGARALSDAGIEVTGWVDREDAMARLDAATAYLHWTAWDGQPLSVLEAMARDVVVVASDIEANRELLGDEQTCADTSEALDLLKAVLADPDRRERLLESQRARRGGFGARRMVAEWRALYKEVAGPLPRIEH